MSQSFFLSLSLVAGFFLHCFCSSTDFTFVRCNIFSCIFQAVRGLQRFQTFPSLQFQRLREFLILFITQARFCEELSMGVISLIESRVPLHTIPVAGLGVCVCVIIWLVYAWVVCALTKIEPPEKV